MEKNKEKTIQKTLTQLKRESFHSLYCAILHPERTTIRFVAKLEDIFKDYEVAFEFIENGKKFTVHVDEIDGAIESIGGSSSNTITNAKSIDLTIYHIGSNDLIESIIASGESEKFSRYVEFAFQQQIIIGKKYYHHLHLRSEFEINIATELVALRDELETKFKKQSEIAERLSSRFDALGVKIHNEIENLRKQLDDQLERFDLLLEQRADLYRRNAETVYKLFDEFSSEKTQMLKEFSTIVQNWFSSLTLTSSHQEMSQNVSSLLPRPQQPPGNSEKSLFSSPSQLQTTIDTIDTNEDSSSHPIVKNAEKEKKVKENGNNTLINVEETGNINNNCKGNDDGSGNTSDHEAILENRSLEIIESNNEPLSDVSPPNPPHVSRKQQMNRDSNGEKPLKTYGKRKKTDCVVDDDNDDNFSNIANERIRSNVDAQKKCHPLVPMTEKRPIIFTDMHKKKAPRDDNALSQMVSWTQTSVVTDSDLVKAYSTTLDNVEVKDKVVLECIHPVLGAVSNEGLELRLIIWPIPREKPNETTPSRIIKETMNLFFKKEIAEGRLMASGKSPTLLPTQSGTQNIQAKKYVEPSKARTYAKLLKLIFPGILVENYWDEKVVKVFNEISISFTSSIANTETKKNRNQNSIGKSVNQRAKTRRKK